MTEIVAVDIGGTHARFALARTEGGRIVLEPETVFRTGEHAGLAAAWQAYAASLDRPLPARAGIAVAAPVGTPVVRLTNNHWVLRPAAVADELGLEAVTLVNDFAAVAHAVAVCGPEHLVRLCGPDTALPDEGVISVVGPGTGLGVAILHRDQGGDRVIATEGGHIDFAPLDAFEDRLLGQIRAKHRRVSVERVVSGPGLAAIASTLGMAERPDDSTLWRLALEGGDPIAAEALERFCRSLGSVAGDLALAHGASCVVIAGGLGLRLAATLPRSDFAERFAAKGRFADYLRALPVKLITHPQPGLLGAAAAAMKRAPLQG